MEIINENSKLMSNFKRRKEGKDKHRKNRHFCASFCAFDEALNALCQNYY